MELPNSVPPSTQDDDQCACSICSGHAATRSIAGFIAQALTGLAFGVVACIKGMYLNVSPWLACGVSTAVGLYIIWGLNKR